MKNTTPQAKLDHLKAILAEMGGLLVGYSGGVDSTFLSVVAHQVLGGRMLAVMVNSEVISTEEAEDAVKIAKELKIPHRVVEASVMAIEGFDANPPDRCYHCKLAIFGKLKAMAKEAGLACVADGANVDDVGDYRPGTRAIRELGVRSPLKEAGLSKAEIRALSREMGLPTWDKAALACLATRMPYGVMITGERLRMIEAAEAFLHAQGVGQARVRLHPLAIEKGGGGKDESRGGGALARIEVTEADLPRFAEAAFRKKVTERLKKIGFLYIALDLQGYRTGSMNEGLKKS